MKESLIPMPRWHALVLAAAVLTSHTNGVSATYPAPSLACSNTNASWEVKNFAVDTKSKFYYGQGTVGKASFSIKNLANGYEFACTQGSGRDVSTPNFSLKDGKVWYSCNDYCHGSETNPPLDTSFSFDVASKSLSVAQKWSCALNGSTPYVWSPYTFIGSAPQTLTTTTVRPFKEQEVLQLATSAAPRHQVPARMKSSAHQSTFSSPRQLSRRQRDLRTAFPRRSMEHRLAAGPVRSSPTWQHHRL
jgi:hypothetical protein